MKEQIEIPESIGSLTLRIPHLVLILGVAAALVFCSFPEDVQAENKGTIVVGGDYDYPPYSFLDKNGDPQGFDVDLIKTIAKKIDVEITFVFTPWDEAVSNLKSGKIDLLMAALYTEDRTRFFEFTIPYHMDYYSIFSREESGIRSINELQGKKVIMLNGDASIEKFIIPLGLLQNITYTASYPDAFKLLLAGRHDYILAPFAIAQHTLKELEEQEENTDSIVSTGETLLPSQYRLAVKKGNAELLTKLNDSLDALKSEKGIQRLREKWIMERPTSWQTPEVIQYVLLGLVPIGFLVVIAFAWSWSLKKQVNAKSESLRIAVRKAEMANLAKSRFMANMSHEIRTPLNAISGFSQALIIDSEKRSLGEEFAKIAENIQKAGEQLLGIIENILEISKIEVDEVRPNPEEFNLKKDVQAVYGLNKVRALKQGVVFNYGYDSDLPEIVRSDKVKLNRILTILIGNAIKFTPPEKSIWLKLKREDDFFVLQLEDQGIGIEERYLKEIFEPFVQVDDSITKKYSGTGLGLTIAKAYVEMLNGTIAVQSRKDHGSVFIVKLPLNAVEAKEDDGASVPSF